MSPRFLPACPALNRRDWVRSLSLFLLMTLLVYLLLHQVPKVRSPVSAGHKSHPRTVMRLSMYTGDERPQYEKALETHRRHATMWGEDFDVLKNELGKWSKLDFMLQKLWVELAKPSSKRVEWLMWVDADSIVLNPSIDVTLFLPPPDLDHLHLVATIDDVGLNIGVFFLRVHAWSVSLLLKTLAMPSWRPDIPLIDVHADQDAMEVILRETEGGFHGSAVYLPRTWINAYHIKEEFDGKKGDLLVHFPGVTGALRDPRMDEWLNLLDASPEQWNVPLDKTGYINDTRSFWAGYREIANLTKAPEPPETETESVRTVRLELLQALQDSSQDLQALDVLRQRLAAERGGDDESGQVRMPIKGTRVSPTIDSTDPGVMWKATAGSI